MVRAMIAKVATSPKMLTVSAPAAATPRPDWLKSAYLAAPQMARQTTMVTVIAALALLVAAGSALEQLVHIDYRSDRNHRSDPNPPTRH